MVLSAAFVGSRGLFFPLGTFDLNELDLATIAKYDSSLAWTRRIPIAKWWQMTGRIFSRRRMRTSVRTPCRSGSQFSRIRNSATAVTDPGNGVDGTRLPRRRFRLQLAADEGAEAANASLHDAGNLYMGETDDGRRQSPSGLCRRALGAPQDGRTSGLEHSVSPQDVKYQFTGTAFYDLPVGKGPGR